MAAVSSIIESVLYMFSVAISLTRTIELYNGSMHQAAFEFAVIAIAIVAVVVVSFCICRFATFPSSCCVSCTCTVIRVCDSNNCLGVVVIGRLFLFLFFVNSPYSAQSAICLSQICRN